MVTATMKLKDTFSLEGEKKSYDKPRLHIRNLTHHVANKGPNSAMVFPVFMQGNESWTIKKVECQRIDALNCGNGEAS